MTNNNIKDSDKTDNKEERKGKGKTKNVNSVSSPPSWNEIKKHILAGAVAGSTTSLLLGPLDVVKTRMRVTRPFETNDGRQ